MTQLVLLTTTTDATQPAHGWRIDEHTRDVGRQGLVAARAALRAARQRLLDREPALVSDAA